MAISFGGQNFSNIDSFLRWYQQTFMQLVPQIKPPKAADPNQVLAGVRPVLEAEERGARQRAASQFAKLGMPVSSAYMERLGRIGGETAAKMADITNRYAFEAAQKQADLEMQAALANQRAALEMLQGAGLFDILKGGGGFWQSSPSGGGGGSVQSCMTACQNGAPGDAMCFAYCQAGDMVSAQRIIEARRQQGILPGNETFETFGGVLECLNRARQNASNEADVQLLFEACLRDKRRQGNWINAPYNKPGSLPWPIRMTRS